MLYVNEKKYSDSKIFINYIISLNEDTCTKGDATLVLYEMSYFASVISIRPGLSQSLIGGCYFISFYYVSLPLYFIVMHTIFAN